MPSVRATAPTPAPTPMYNADWLSICRRPMRSGLPKQRSGPVLDHDGDRRFAEECVPIARIAKSPETRPNAIATVSARTL
jgi:hypothetical protein